MIGLAPNPNLASLYLGQASTRGLRTSGCASSIRRAIGARVYGALREPCLLIAVRAPWFGAFARPGARDIVPRLLARPDDATERTAGLLGFDREQEALSPTLPE